MIQMIDPFRNPTGSVAKHISSIGLKIHIIMNDSDILSKVGSYHSSPFHVLSHAGNMWSSLLAKGESPAIRAFSCVMCDLA